MSEVQDALSDYVKLNKQAGKEDHPKPDPEEVKESLLEISEEWYEKIIKVIPKNKRSKKIISVNDIK